MLRGPEDSLEEMLNHPARPGPLRDLEKDLIEEPYLLREGDESLDTALYVLEMTEQGERILMAPFEVLV